MLCQPDARTEKETKKPFKPIAANFAICFPEKDKKNELLEQGCHFLGDCRLVTWFWERLFFAYSVSHQELPQENHPKIQALHLLHFLPHPHFEHLSHPVEKRITVFNT